MSAWLELLRLPNVLTAWGDPIVGALWAGGINHPGRISTAVAGVLFVYIGGMILNDVADRATDARERPGRPLPSGRICSAHAAWAGAGCMVAGGAAFVASGTAVACVGAPLIALAMLYNFAIKKTWAGPIAMGGCRTLSVLMGAVAAGWGNPGPWVAAAILGGYVAMLSAAARNEMSGGRWTAAHTGRALGLIPLVQAILCAMAISAGPTRWAWSAALVLMLPIHAAMRRRWPAG